MFSPLKLGAESIGLIELVHAQGSIQSAEHEDLPMLSALGELAADFQRHERLRNLPDARDTGADSSNSFRQPMPASICGPRLRPSSTKGGG